MSQFVRNSFGIVHRIAHNTSRHYRSLHSSQRYFSSLSTSSSSSSSSSSRPSVPAFVFDIDGVLIRGKALLPTARDALRKVTRREDGGVHPTGLPHIFLTNGGGVTELQKAKQLSQLFGVQVKPENVILSHTPMLDLLDEYRHVPVLTLGMTDVRSVAESYGFEKVLIPEDLIAQHPDLVPHLTEHARAKVHKMANPDTNTALESIRAIFVMHDPNEWYRDLQLTMDLLTMHITKATRSSNQPTETPLTPPKIYFSNPDFLFTGRAKHPRLAQGAFRVCLQALYETFTGEPLPMKLYGKPNAVTYRYAERTLARQAEEFGVTISHYYGIGDNPASDIRGANLAGPHWSSIFVQTGTIAKSKHEEEQPKYELACVNEAVDFIIKKEDETQK